MRSRTERAGFCQLGQRHHRRHIIGAKRDGFHTVDHALRWCSDHLLAHFGKHNLELGRRGHGVGREQHGNLGSGHDRAERREALRGHIRHVGEGRDRSGIAQRPRAAFRQRALPGCQCAPDRTIKRMVHLPRAC
jgi:hypothetical protein